MKKLLALLLAAAMLLSLCACGTSNKPKELEDISDEDWEAAAEALEDMYEDEEPVVETEPTEKIYELSETIIVADGLVEFKLDSIQYVDMIDRYSLEPVSEKGMTPSEGNVFLFFSGTVNCDEGIKEQINTQFSKMELDYNNGYKFYGYEGDIRFLEEEGNRNYAEFKPLSGNYARTFIGYVEVPVAVENDSESPILFSFKFNCYVPGGTNYSTMCTVKFQ